jgi:murein L,D-transpeptidase YcbB/YkuD
VVACATSLTASTTSGDPPPVRDELHIVVNVAGNRLDVYEGEERTYSYRVSVGMRGYETPAGQYRISEITWNPWWHPPDSKWARGRKPEPPGELNPMGRVKLNFAPLLYIHGTPDTQALGAPSSRGCIRMRNSDVIELTRLVHRYASPRLDQAAIDGLENSPSTTRRIALAKPVRLTAVYQVATVRDGFLIIYPDVYRQLGSKVRSQIDRVLAQNGVDPRTVDRRRLDRLIEKGSTRRVAVDLDSLVVDRDMLELSSEETR